jgi:uroporphyrinogen decarboxylase
MTSRERVLSACRRTGYDRIPIKHEGTPEVNQQLKDHFGLKNDEQLLRVLGDDFRYVSPVYRGPKLRTFPDGSIEGYWGERYRYAEFEGGRYLEAVYLPFAGILDPVHLDHSRFPSADWFDFSTIREQAQRLRDAGFAVCCGTAGDLDFINGISRCRGMEQVLIDLVDGNAAFLEIMEARFHFYHDLHERMLSSAQGLIDFAHVGEDLGNQRGQMISDEVFERHFAPRYQAYFTMVHRHGARTMMHMCGTVWMFLERLIRLGLDVYDVVQPTPPENDIESLVQRFGDRLLFQGSMDVQRELAFGTVEDVRKAVQRRLRLFPKGGFIMGPSHAIQAKSPLENTLALYRESGSLLEDIPAWVRGIEGPEQTGPDLSKLF